MKPAWLNPVEVDVETEEQEAAYVAWLRAKIQEAIDDPSPGIPHDAVMAEMHAIIAQAKARPVGA